MSRAGATVGMCCLALVSLGGCKRQDMVAQGSVRNWDRSTFFKDGLSMRPAVPGTVARDPADPDAPMPAAIDAALLARGEQRYAIFCTPCHGRAGNGEGMIVQRGFPHPPSFVSGPLRHADAQLFYDAITHGYGAMYSYASRVPSADRWAIVAYIRALQLSQDTDPAALPPGDGARLAALPPASPGTKP